MAYPLNIIIVEKVGLLKMLSIKDFKLEDLYKKCGFKKAENFIKQTEWNVKYDGEKYTIQVFGKKEGRPNSENKYDFPPPIDSTLFYGSCAIVGQIKNKDGNKSYINLSLPIWNLIYEKLFGGFDDLSATAKEDEEEEDELDNIPKEKKTKQGYLKDGFVVDSTDTEDTSVSDLDDVCDDDNTKTIDSEEPDVSGDGSELSEESYDYDDKKVC